MSGESQCDDIIPGADVSNPIKDPVENIRAVNNDPVENIRAVNNDPVENIRAVNSGDEFFACLQAIPPGRNAKSQGYSYNRFIRVLNFSGNLPVDFTELNYGSMKIGPKNLLH